MIGSGNSGDIFLLDDGRVQHYTIFRGKKLSVPLLTRSCRLTKKPRVGKKKKKKTVPKQARTPAESR